MTHFKFIFILLAAVISLAGSILILRHVYKRRAARQEAEAVSSHAAPVPSKTKTKSSAGDKLKAAVFSIGIISILMIVRILRLPIIEILLGGFFLIFSLFFIRHLSLWRKARKPGCAIPVAHIPTAILTVFIAFGLFFGSVGGVLIHVELVKRQRCNQFTQAVVVDYFRKKSTRASSNSHSYYAIVEFNANGQAIRTTSGKGYPDRKYKIDKELTIRYNPQDPQEFIIRGEWNLLPAFFIFFGLFFCVGIPILIFTQFDGKRLRQIQAGK